jgi:hypothetical protein
MSNGCNFTGDLVVVFGSCVFEFLVCAVSIRDRERTASPIKVPNKLIVRNFIVPPGVSAWCVSVMAPQNSAVKGNAAESPMTRQDVYFENDTALADMLKRPML